MPIVLSSMELARIRRWTDAEREEPEVARRRELVRYLDATSRDMTKTWPNSLENVNKRNEELRQARINVAEQANANFYKKYVKRRKEEQERMMFSARDTVFKNKDAPKLLLSAVIETCVQKERMEQLKFLKERRREAAEQKRKEEEDVIRKAQEWEVMKAKQRKMRYEVDKKHQMDILEQAHEISERNRIEHETEVSMQKVDNMKADQQMDAIKEFEEQFKASEKARIWSDMEQAKRELDARRAEQLARDKMDDKLIEVIHKSRFRVEKKRLDTEKELKQAQMRVLDRISARLSSGDAEREAREQAILDKAKKERREADKSRRERQAQKAAEIKAERIEQRRQWERDEARRLHCLDTELQWGVMNRFKNVEINEDFQEHLRQEKARKVKEYREEILRLWKEREDREASERAELRHFYGELALKKLRDADNKLLTHAGELIEEARQNERPDYALKQALDRYCRLYRLYPMPPLPKSLAEHFREYAPADGSEPDPGYRAPQPPSHRGSPHTVVAEQAGAKRAGLEDAPKASTSKKREEKTKKEETVADYKRAGRADGLQRKPAEPEVRLPYISVPCLDPCSCAR